MSNKQTAVVNITRIEPIYYFNALEQGAQNAHALHASLGQSDGLLLRPDLRRHVDQLLAAQLLQLLLLALVLALQLPVELQLLRFGGLFSAQSDEDGQ